MLQVRIIIAQADAREWRSTSWAQKLVEDIRYSYLSRSTDAPKARILGHDLVNGETRDCNEVHAQSRRLS
jgi:hypothetical protein